MSVIADRVFELSVRCFQFRCGWHELPRNGISRIIRIDQRGQPRRNRDAVSLADAVGGLVGFAVDQAGIDKVSASAQDHG